jgi:hypothetical protein
MCAWPSDLARFPGRVVEREAVATPRRSPPSASCDEMLGGFLGAAAVGSAADAGGGSGDARL